MDLDLKSKTAVVSGASIGIGRAIAKMLALEGVRVVGVARRRELLDTLAARGQGGGRRDNSGDAGHHAGRCREQAGGGGDRRTRPRRHPRQQCRRQPAAAGRRARQRLGRGHVAEFHPLPAGHPRAVAANDRAQMGTHHQHHRQVRAGRTECGVRGEGRGACLGEGIVARDRAARHHRQQHSARPHHERADPAQLSGRLSQAFCRRRDSGALLGRARGPRRAGGVSRLARGALHHRHGHSRSMAACGGISSSEVRRMGGAQRYPSEFLREGDGFRCALPILQGLQRRSAVRSDFRISAIACPVAAVPSVPPTSRVARPLCMAAATASSIARAAVV